MSTKNSSIEEARAFLLYALNFLEIKILKEESNVLYLEKGYAIEIENENLFKLLSDNAVIAPFDDIEELCIFIKQG